MKWEEKTSPDQDLEIDITLVIEKNIVLVKDNAIDLKNDIVAKVSKGEKRYLSFSHSIQKKSKFSEGPADHMVMNKANELSSKLNQNLYGAKDEIKNLSIMKKLNPANKNLGLGLTLV